jgi:4-amino-4-deoxy-L-arabinose transferase-like glycosyltransferase
VNLLLSNPCLLLLSATSQTHSLVVSLSVFTLILLGILIEGLIKGRFTGGVGFSRAKSPIFFYLNAALLAYVIVRVSLFIKDLIRSYQ